MHRSRFYVVSFLIAPYSNLLIISLRSTNPAMVYEMLLYAGYSIIIFFDEVFLSSVILYKYIPVLRFFTFKSIFHFGFVK